jgi:hypothetical protein
MHTTVATTATAAAQQLQALALQVKSSSTSYSRPHHEHRAEAAELAVHPNAHSHAHSGMQQRRALIASAAAAIFSSSALLFNTQQASAAVPTIDEYNGGVGSQPKTNNYLNSARAPKQSAAAPTSQVNIIQTIAMHCTNCCRCGTCNGRSMLTCSLFTALPAGVDTCVAAGV